MAKKKKLNSKEKAVIQALHKIGTVASTRELAEEAGISWTTAKKYLEEFEAKGIVINIGSGEKSNPRWRLNYKEINL